jgi:hypothetical protein
MEIAPGIEVNLPFRVNLTMRYVPGLISTITGSKYNQPWKNNFSRAGYRIPGKRYLKKNSLRIIYRVIGVRITDISLVSSASEALCDSASFAMTFSLITWILYSPGSET